MGEYDVISVIVPIYNVKEYLERCVESIITQTYEKMEIILVDDGSTDGCRELCDSYKNKDKRIKVIHQENQGLSGARNAGIDIARGKYIVFIDSDDFIATSFVEKLYSICLKYNADIAICDYLQGNYKEFPLYRQGNVLCLEAQDMLEKWHSVYTRIETVAWNKMYKRSVFDSPKVRYPKGLLHEDVMTTHLCVYNCKRIAILKEKLYMYFVRDNSINQTMSPKRIQDIIYVNEQRYLWFLNHGYIKSAIRLKAYTLKVYMEFYCKAYYAKVDDFYLTLLLNKFDLLYDEVINIDSEISIKERILFWSFKNLRFIIVNFAFRLYKCKWIRELVKREI